MGRPIEIPPPLQDRPGRWYDLFVGRATVTLEPGMFKTMPGQENPADRFNRIVAEGGGLAELDAAANERMRAVDTG